MHDKHYMQRAYDLALKGQFFTRPNPCVGAVVVDHQGRVVGEGYHQKAGSDHAEVIALDHAGSAARGATLYVTLEPCCHQGKTPPCVKRIIAAGIVRVVMAYADHNPLVNGNGKKQLIDAGISVDIVALKNEIEPLNEGYVSTHKRQRPFVRLKMAMSIDGKTAMSDGQSQWITGEASRENVQHLRAKSGAIITGIGTLLRDNPSLTVRTDSWLHPPKNPVPAPLRVVVDSTLKLSINAKLFASAGPIWVICTDKGFSAQPQKVSALKAKGVRVLAFASHKDQVDLSVLLDHLTQASIHDVLVESGHTLAGRFIDLGLVDELWCYIAPKIMGSKTKGLFHLPDIKSLTAHKPLSLLSSERFGDDIRLVYACLPT